MSRMRVWNAFSIASESIRAILPILARPKMKVRGAGWCGAGFEARPYVISTKNQAYSAQVPLSNCQPPYPALKHRCATFHSRLDVKVAISTNLPVCNSLARPPYSHYLNGYTDSCTMQNAPNARFINRANQTYGRRCLSKGLEPEL